MRHRHFALWLGLAFAACAVVPRVRQHIRHLRRVNNITLALLLQARWRIRAAKCRAWARRSIMARVQQLRACNREVTVMESVPEEDILSSMSTAATSRARRKLFAEEEVPASISTAAATVLQSNARRKLSNAARYVARVQYIQVLVGDKATNVSVATSRETDTCARTARDALRGRTVGAGREDESTRQGRC